MSDEIPLDITFFNQTRYQSRGTIYTIVPIHSTWQYAKKSLTKF